MTSEDEINFGWNTTIQKLYDTNKKKEVTVKPDLSIAKVSQKELNILYKQWLLTQQIRINCSQYPEFLAATFPNGVVVN